MRLEVLRFGRIVFQDIIECAAVAANGPSHGKYAHAVDYETCPGAFQQHLLTTWR
jgi:hypothetical protein